MIIWLKYAPLGAMALILVECSYIGGSTADPSPVSLRQNLSSFDLPHVLKCQMTTIVWTKTLFVWDLYTLKTDWFARVPKKKIAKKVWNDNLKFYKGSTNGLHGNLCYLEFCFKYHKKNNF